MNVLTKLKDGLQNGSILTSKFLSDSVIEEALNSRDSRVFESEWLRVYGLFGNLSFEMLPSIREAAYKAAFALFENPEMAGYVSDDFGLIAAGLEMGIDDRWLNGLLYAYRHDSFPAGLVMPCIVNLRDQLNNQ